MYIIYHYWLFTRRSISTPVRQATVRSRCLFLRLGDWALAGGPSAWPTTTLNCFVLDSRM